MRTFTVTRADIDRCPRKRMDVRHYRNDGSCMCPGVFVAPFHVESKHAIESDETLNLETAKRWANERYTSLGYQARIRVVDTHGTVVFRPTKQTTQET